MNKVKESDYSIFIFILSIVLIVVFNAIYMSNIINFPNWILLVIIFVASVTCLVNKIIKTKNKWTSDIVISLIKKMFFYSLLFLGVSLNLFGCINKLYTGQNDLENSIFKIERVTNSTSRSLSRIIFNFDEKEVYLKTGPSKLVSDLILDQSVLEKAYIYIEYKKGLLGTYIIYGNKIIIR